MFAGCRAIAPSIPQNKRTDHIRQTPSDWQEDLLSDPTKANKKLIMENNSLKTQIEEPSQQVEDLQLHASNTDATNKKCVRVSDDSG